MFPVAWLAQSVARTPHAYKSARPQIPGCVRTGDDAGRMAPRLVFSAQVTFYYGCAALCPRSYGLLAVPLPIRH